MRVVKGFWRLLVGIKDALVLLLLLLFFAALFAALSVRPNPAIPTSGALVLKLDGTIVEQPADADPLAVLSGNGPATREYRLRDVVRALRVASTDANVKAVVLDLDRFAGGGQAALAETGEAIDAVRRGGKPVLVYATGYADDGYQLAAHASEVWLNPLGAVFLAGRGGSQLYYKGLLDKIGVTAHLYRVGRFKSAGEPYIRADQSPEAKQANQALADSLWARWGEEVSKARPKAKLAAYISDPAGSLERAGNDTGKAATDAGLVDQLGDRIAFGRRVAAIAGAATTNRPGDYQALPLDRYLAAHPESAAGRVGVLTIAGEIVDGERGPGTAGGETIARLLTDELGKKRIKALVIRVDSPGGSVTGSERIRSAILEAKAQGLPIIVSMGSVAASGGYWVSTPGQAVFADPATITGSIGVFALIPTFEGALAKIGLSADGVATTPLSGQPDVLRGTSPTVDRLIQGSITSTYARFMNIVGAARHMTPQHVDEIGQGHVWAGGTARQLGLVDRFGGIDDAIAFAASAAKLSGADARPRWIEREPNPYKALLRDWTERKPEGDADAVVDPLARIARAPQTAALRALTDASAILSGPVVQVRCLECGGATTPPDPAAVRALLPGLLARLGR
ncbi:signal peptide peptidase SppA [Sphingomonas sp. BIUV-7]|uniref:Signal peptide peptidase SppA n=1 Tax=Sphingomonas natans TaxID=3063330 RepID=A0ABT8YDI5_9SPHN|nr:signal peptide peptidase SppA [Sphingomonas sp. BIUV-7]MDO6416381.1 signal peptide peptidase SppA [Sphingomonas sp. BIUV-7]